jgi:transcription elongation factor/antiterminator RfaH
MSNRGGEFWYAVNTQPAHEAMAREHLERQGFPSFLPMTEKLVRHARKLETRRAALFPGYLFTRFDIERARWRAVNGTLGVRGLVMAADLPLPVPRGIVETLRDATDASGVVALSPELAPGDRVRILSGPFANLLGTVATLTGPERVRLLVELMHGALPVSLRRRHVIRVA